MSYSTEENVKHRDVEQVIQQVFQISGVKLTIDDPIVAVLVLQQRNQASSFFQLQEETQKLLDAVTEIKKYREQVLMELMGEARRTSEQIEERMIGVLSKHLLEFNNHIGESSDKDLNKYYLVFAVLTGVIVGSMLHLLF